MKRVLSILLALLLSCSLLSAAAEEDVLGEWYMTGLRLGDMQIDPALLGFTIVLSFREDGTGLLCENENGQQTLRDFSWEIRDGRMFMTGEGDGGEMNLLNGFLLISTGNGDMVFSREKPLPPTVSADSEDAFLGEWALYAMELKGMPYTADVLNGMGMGASCTLKIQKGSASLLLCFMGSEFPLEGGTAFADGALAVSVPDSDPVTIRLLEDGGLFLTLNMPGGELPLYLVPASAEEAPAA